MKKLFIVLILFIGLAAGILFSTAGQKGVLLPLANFYLHWKVPEHRIALSRLEPGPASLKLQGTVDGAIAFDAAGPVEWFRRRFTMNYRIRAREVPVGQRSYPVRLELKGTAEGSPEAIRVSGGGRGFDARLSYRFLLKGSGIRGVEIRAEGARVDQLLALTGRPPYASGALDLQVDMPRLDSENPEGSARFSVKKGTVDPKLLQRDFGIGLSRAEKYRLEGNFRLAAGLVKGKARLETALLTLGLEEFRSDTAFRIFKSRYRLDIPELSQLRRLTRTELFGPWQSDGEFFYDRKKGMLQVRGTSPSLEGKTRFFYDGGRLDLTLEKTGIPQILALTGQPALTARGTLSGHMLLTDLRKPAGRYRLRAEGRWDRVEVAKLTGSDPGEALDFRLESDGTLSKGVLDSRVSYRNRLFGLELPELRYALKEGAMEGHYRLRVPDPGRFKSLAQSGAHGSIDVTGTLSYLPVKKLLKVDGVSRSLGGESRFVYAGRRLSVTLKKVDGARLMRLAGQEPLLTGAQVDATLKLSDLRKKIGNFSLSAAGILDRKQMRKLHGIDPGPTFRVRLKGTGEIHGARVGSRWTLESRKARLALDHCDADLESRRCSGEYRVNIPELEQFKALTGRSYHGPLTLAGKVRWDGKLHLGGGGREWGGRIAYALEGALLRVRTEKLDAQQLMKMLGYTPMIEGAATSDLRYNLESRKGTLKAEMQKARFIPGALTLVASRLLHYDLSKEVFGKVLFSSQIAGPSLIFNLSTRSQRLDLEVQRGKIDRDKGRINALVTIVDRGKRYRLKLSGPLAHPRVTPLVTQDLVKKVEKEMKKHKIDKKIEKAIPKELQQPGNPVTDFIQKLF